ncbi:MAG TPA: CvpA family protein [Desulfuromonadaceae bacterium]|jgi:membrane protein required for colicin V production
MNPFDVIIIAVLIIFAVKGLTRGFINEASSLAGLILGGWLAYRYYPVVSVPIQKTLHLPAHISAFLAFMLLLILTGIIAHIVGNLITTAVRVVMLGSINRLGGLLIGATEGALLLSMLFCIATASFMPAQLKQKITSTESANMFAQIGDSLLLKLRAKTGEKP